MSSLVFDIETIGEDFSALDSTTQGALTRWLKRESYDNGEYERALDDVKNGLGFSPLTGQIVAIGILDVERGKGAVYYQAPGEKHDDFEEEGIIFKQKTEADMLANFWQVAEKFTTFVSFNGRCFDAPYLVVRSAIHRVKPSKNLLSNRYLSMQRGAEHVDLLDQLSFYGAMRRRGSLHLWSRAFGIKSPKEDGVSGDDVAGLFKEKKYVDIARYNVGDLRATKELFELWKKYFVI